jgi:glycosyltransferase involved in cell wall biosynthesis
LSTLFVAPSLRRAGAETQLIELVNGLDDGRFEKSLFTFHPDLSQRDRLRRGSVVHVVKNRRNRFDFRPVGSLAKIIRRRHAEIVHCTLQIAVFFGWMACRLSLRKPMLVAAVHTTLNRSRREDVFDRVLYRWALMACRRVIFVCHRQREHWVAKYPFLRRRAAVIYNGIDPVRYSPESAAAAGRDLRKQLGIPEAAPVISNVAGFRPEKGHAHLIAAFSGLEGRPRLLLAGDGETRPAVRRWAREAGVMDRVHFLGMVPDVRPVLAASDVSVLASTAVETFSMAMLESLSMEVPVVGTRIGGFEEAVEDGRSGYAVPPADSEALGDALARVLSNPENRRKMGRNGRRVVWKRFGRRRMIRETERVLSECGRSLPK